MRKARVDTFSLKNAFLLRNKSNQRSDEATAVFRVEKNKGYTVMSNHHLRNKELLLNKARLEATLEESLLDGKKPVKKSAHASKGANDSSDK